MREGHAPSGGTAVNRDDPEALHHSDQGIRLFPQALGCGRRLLDQRGVLLRGLVHLRHRAVHLLDAGGLLLGGGRAGVGIGRLDDGRGQGHGRSGMFRFLSPVFGLDPGGARSALAFLDDLEEDGVPLLSVDRGSEGEVLGLLIR